MDYSPYILQAVIICALVTFMLRLSGRIAIGKFPISHPLVVWATYVAFSTVSALTIKLIFFPSGEMLKNTPIDFRFFAVVTTIVVFFLVKKNFFIATILGVLLFYVLLFLEK